jgi:hypothetical protein
MRAVRGTADAARARLVATQGNVAAVINTAYIERLNATCRARLAPLARRARATARLTATVAAGMWLAGTGYTFCWPHRSLRQRRPTGLSGDKWVARPPAQAAGLTDHRWSRHEPLPVRVPPAPVKRRGRPPRWVREVARAA